MNSEAFIWVTLTGPGEVVCASEFNNLIYSAHSWRNPFSWPQCVLRTVHLDPEGPSVVSVSLLFSVPNCYAFQKYKLSLLGLNKVFLFTTKRKACHVQSTRCTVCFLSEIGPSLHIHQQMASPPASFTIPVLVTAHAISIIWPSSRSFRRKNRVLPPSPSLTSVPVRGHVAASVLPCDWGWADLHSDSNLGTSASRPSLGGTASVLKAEREKSNNLKLSVFRFRCHYISFELFGGRRGILWSLWEGIGNCQLWFKSRIWKYLWENSPFWGGGQRNNWIRQKIKVISVLGNKPLCFGKTKLFNVSSFHADRIGTAFPKWQMLSSPSFDIGIFLPLGYYE